MAKLNYIVWSLACWIYEPFKMPANQERRTQLPQWFQLIGGNKEAGEETARGRLHARDRERNMFSVFCLIASDLRWVQETQRMKGRRKVHLACGDSAAPTKQPMCSWQLAAVNLTQWAPKQYVLSQVKNTLTRCTRGMKSLDIIVQLFYEDKS